MNSIQYDTETRLGTVEGKVRAIVESMNEDVEYRFMYWAQANVEMDRISKPTIIYVLPPSGTLDFKWNEVKDYPEAAIAFVCHTEFDFEGTENDNLIEQMKRLAIRFVKCLNESGLFEQIEGRNDYKVIYDFLDANVTGILIEFQLKEEVGVDICEDEVRLDTDE